MRLKIIQCSHFGSVASMSNVIHTISKLDQTVCLTEAAVHSNKYLNE